MLLVSSGTVAVMSVDEQHAEVLSGCAATPATPATPAVDAFGAVTSVSASVEPEGVTAAREVLLSALMAHHVALSDRVRALAELCVGRVESWWFDSDGFGATLTLPGGEELVVDDLYVVVEELSGLVGERQVAADARNALVDELSGAVFEDERVRDLLRMMRSVVSSVECHRSAVSVDW